jgi:segregation and condensation protein A
MNDEREARKPSKRARRLGAPSESNGAPSESSGAPAEEQSRGHRPAELDDPDRQAPDLSVESPAAREREGGPLVQPARPGVTFKLPRFEGPLDLLLHLIKRDEMDIHDIQISHITRQYLQYIELMRMLDLDVAGEFLVMAATLMRIKAKMLLPLPSTTEEEDEGDPREELVQRLLEYRLYKEAAIGLGEHEGVRRTLHERGNPPTEDDAGPLPLAPATLFDLLGALQRVMARRAEKPVYSVQTEGYDIEEMMSLLARTVAEEGQLRFSDVMLRARARMEIIVSFMALLELIKLGTVTCVQEANFADILILPRLQERVGPDAAGTPALGR